MKTRRRTKLCKSYIRKTRRFTNYTNSNIDDLLSSYNDLLNELLTKKQRFLTTFKTCLKWNPIQPSYYSFKSFSYQKFDNSIYHKINGHSLITTQINRLKDDILKIHTDWAEVHTICEVAYRKHYGLLHTLPSKKMDLFSETYPNIAHLISVEKQTNNTNDNQPTQLLPKKTNISFGEITYI
tara:strand:+ start:2844 stop:3389 length:546 start_codon:yes stop_codon:yes gene_type:complete